jgi:small-conductance mechanosensitive channel
MTPCGTTAKQELEIRNTNTAIIKYKNETSYYISKEIGLALLVLILIFVLISFKKVVGPLLNQTARRKAHPRNKIRTLFDAKQQVKLNVNTVLKWLLIALLIYALPILQVFHGLKALPLLFGYILNPLKRWGSVLELLDLITILVIIFVFRYVKGIHTLNVKLKRKFRITVLSRLGKPHYQITCCFCFYVNRFLSPRKRFAHFRGVSVFLGFLFTFGSAGSLSNIIAGLILTYMRLFKIGDE